MQAGKRDRRISIERVTETQTAGGNGEPLKSWATLGTAWAAFEPADGSESFAEGEERVSWQPAKFTFPYRTDIVVTTKDRVVTTFGGATKYWEILGVHQLGRNHDIVLDCRTRGE